METAELGSLGIFCPKQGQGLRPSAAHLFYLFYFILFYFIKFQITLNCTRQFDESEVGLRQKTRFLGISHVIIIDSIKHGSSALPSPLR